VLQSQGRQLNQLITFLSNGGDTVRDLQFCPYLHAQPLLDCFQVGMRLTMLQQTVQR